MISSPPMWSGLLARCESERPRAHLLEPSLRELLVDRLALAELREPRHERLSERLVIQCRLRPATGEGGAPTARVDPRGLAAVGDELVPVGILLLLEELDVVPHGSERLADRLDLVGRRNARAVVARVLLAQVGRHTVAGLDLRL